MDHRKSGDDKRSFSANSVNDYRFEIIILRNAPDAKELANEIGSDPEIMDGLPIFTGTRIPVYIVLDYLAEGFSLPEIKKDFPSMDDKKIKAALKFAGLLSTLH